jgi:two-component system nitrate/nitrite response regulator NarL
MEQERQLVGTVDARSGPNCIRIALLTPLRLLAESLRPFLLQQPRIVRVAFAFDFAMLLSLLDTDSFDVALIDVSHGLDSEHVREIALRHSAVRLLALGPEESREDVLRCARCGFFGYVPRDASLDQLGKSLIDAVAGKFRCNDEIMGHLMQALFSADATLLEGDDSLLTLRQSEVARLVERGLSNKAIARQLHLSVATVKNHVHNVLSKRNVSSRMQLISTRVRGTNA